MYSQSRKTLTEYGFEPGMPFPGGDAKGELLEGLYPLFDSLALSAYLPVSLFVCLPLCWKFLLVCLYSRAQSYLLYRIRKQNLVIFLENHFAS